MSAFRMADCLHWQNGAAFESNTANSSIVHNLYKSHGYSALFVKLHPFYRYSLM